MRGLMMDKPLLIQSLIDYAARYHGNTEVVSRTTEGRLYQYTYAQANTRAKQLARALLRLGIGFGTGLPRLPGTIIDTSRPITRSPVSVQYATPSIRVCSLTSSRIS